MQVKKSSDAQRMLSCSLLDEMLVLST